MQTKIAASAAVAALAGFAAGTAAAGWLAPGSGAVLPLALGGAGVAAAAGAAGLLWGRRLTAPLARLADRAGRIAEGEAAAGPEAEGPAEVRRVGREVSAMAERLIAGRERLRENVASLEATNRALLEARDELVRAEKLASVGRLASGIAHEVGNPLSSITSTLDLLRDQADDSLVDHLEGEARRIDEIIGGLLDFARPGEAPVTATDPREVTEETIDLLRVQGRLEEVSVSVDAGPDDLLAQANPDRLQQVLVNLLMNAEEAATEVDREAEDEREEVVVAVRIAADTFGARPVDREYSARREEDPEGVDYRHLRRMDAPPGQFREFPLAEGQAIVRVEVLDSGPGIDDEHEGRIFDPFFTTKEPGEGMGLGLAIAARLTDEMGGVIEAHGRPEGGSVFAVLLPVAGDGRGEAADGGGQPAAGRERRRAEGAAEGGEG